MIYYVVIKIIVHLNDFLGNYQIYYANIRFITKYEAINRFTREKEREKKDNLWYRLENPTGTLGSYLGKQ